MRKRKTRDLVLLAVAVILPVLPTPARGEIRTWVMEGTIRSVTDPLGLIGFAKVEEHVRYTFAFDSGAPDTYPSAQTGVYSGLSSDLLVGTRLLPAGGPTMTVTQAYLFDATSWMSVDGMPGSVYFRLHNDLGTMPPGPELPLEPYPLSEFAWTEFSCTLTGPPSPGNPSGTYLNFYGAVDAFYAVPEPCSMLLFALGTVAFAIRRK